MNNERKNYCKLCRETAGYTQVQAAELLNVCERTLSDYENGGRVPDEIVAKMAEEYNAPMLAWWHLKETSVLGRYLPELIMPATHNDMAFQLVLAEDEIVKVVAGVKEILSNGRIDDDEWSKFAEQRSLINKTAGKLLSVLIYADQLEAKRKEVSQIDYTRD